MSISFSVSDAVKNSDKDPKKEVPTKNNSEKPFPNPIATSGNSAAASSAASFKATQLSESRSTNNHSSIQINPIVLRLGDQKPLILLSVKTLEKFKNHCSLEGFNKLFTGELQLNSPHRCLLFLKILSMVDCTDDFKEILSDCYHLERFRIDETVFNELIDLAMNLEMEAIIQKLLDNRARVINKEFSIILDETKKTIFKTHPSSGACQKLSQFSDKLKIELSQEKPALTFLFKELLYDAECLDNSEDSTLKTIFDQLKVKRGPFKCIGLIEESRYWGLKDLEKKYLDELRSKTLNTLEATSNKSDIKKAIESRDIYTIIQRVCSTVELAYFVFGSSTDIKLSIAFDNFFETHLREFIIFPDIFDKIVKLIFKLPVENLDLSRSNLKDRNLAMLANIKTLKKLNIQGCSHLTSEGIRRFKAQSKAEIIEKIRVEVPKENKTKVEDKSNTKIDKDSLNISMGTLTFSDGTVVDFTLEFLYNCGNKLDDTLEVCMNNAVENEMGISGLDFLTILKNLDIKITDEQLEKINATKLEEQDYVRLASAARKFGFDKLAEDYRLYPQALDYLNKMHLDKFQTLLSNFPEELILEYSDEKYSNYPEVAKMVTALVQEILPKPHERISILETPTALVLEVPPKSQEELRSDSVPLPVVPFILPSPACKKFRNEISLGDVTASKQVTYFTQQVRFLDGATLMLSPETMKILSQNCTSEGFKKICLGKLNIPALYFVRILSDLNCNENIKDLPGSPVLLNMDTYSQLVAAADVIEAQNLVQKYMREMPSMFNKLIFTSIRDRTLQLPVSEQALQKLFQVSPTASLEKAQGTFKLPNDFALREMMNDAGCFDTLNSSDLRIKIYLALFYKKEPHEILTLVDLATEWGIDFLQKRYMDMFRKICLDLIKEASAVVDISMINEIDDIINLLNLNCVYSQSSLDQELQATFDHFFSLLLGKLLKDSNKFNELVNKLKNLSIGKLDFSKSNLEDKHLLPLARITNLKEIDIQRCKLLTGAGLKDFKEELGLRKVQILCDKDLEEASIKVGNSEALMLPPIEVTFKDGVSISSDFIELLEKTTDFDNVYEVLNNNGIEDLGISSQDFQTILRDIKMGISNPEDIKMKRPIDAAEVLCLDKLVKEYRALTKS